MEQTEMFEEKIRERAVCPEPSPRPTEVREVQWQRTPDREAEIEKEAAALAEASAAFEAARVPKAPGNRYRQVMLNIPAEVAETIEQIVQGRGSDGQPADMPLHDKAAQLLMIGLRTIMTARPVTPPPPPIDMNAARAKLRALKGGADASQHEN